MPLKFWMVLWIHLTVTCNEILCWLRSFFEFWNKLGSLFEHYDDSHSGKWQSTNIRAVGKRAKTDYLKLLLCKQTSNKNHEAQIQIIASKAHFAKTFYSAVCLGDSASSLSLICRILFKKIKTVLCVHTHAWRSEDKLWSWFYFSFIWILGIEHRSQGLVAILLAQEEGI